MLAVSINLNNEPIMTYTAEEAPKVGKEIQVKGQYYKITKVDTDSMTSMAVVEAI